LADISAPHPKEAFSVADACATMAHKPEISIPILARKASDFKQLSVSWLWQGGRGKWRHCELISGR
jgi:hypothetical protein